MALVLLGVFTSGLTQQYIIGGSGARQRLGPSMSLLFGPVFGPYMASKVLEKGFQSKDLYTFGTFRRPLKAFKRHFEAV